MTDLEKMQRIFKFSEGRMKIHAFPDDYGIVVDTQLKEHPYFNIEVNYARNNVFISSPSSFDIVLLRGKEVVDLFDSTKQRLDTKTNLIEEYYMFDKETL